MGLQRSLDKSVISCKIQKRKFILTKKKKRREHEPSQRPGRNRAEIKRDGKQREMGDF